MKKYCHKVQRGFTLTELMVTLVILGIILSIGLPSFSLSSSNARLSSSINAMTGALQLARSEAIKRIINAGISPIDSQRANATSWSTATALVVFVDNDKDGNRNSDTSEDIQYYDLAKNITVVDSGFNPIYRPDGRINSIGGNFTLADKGAYAPNTPSKNCRLLTIANTGRTSCCKRLIMESNDSGWLKCDDMTKQCTFSNDPPSCPPSP